MSFLKDIAKAVERLPEGIQHARADLIGTFRPNRRHDEPEEIAHDKLRAEINASHRFLSFATQRSENIVKWHVDGNDYLWAVSELLDNARECIFILDWWLTPELYLRRPPAFYPQWRLDKILQRKAQQGVKIYVVVYKEVTQTMTMSSSHTKKALEALHPNIAVMRHPDHIGSKDRVEFWSHHEKLVVVDNHFACVGGLDLCFGRWDTHNHPLADVHLTEFSRTLFPGQDYNNARISDFQDVYNYVSGTIYATETARMPWHDVHMTLTGPSVLDLVQHFVERWNEIKKRKYREDPHFDWLALPHDVAAAPEEAVCRHPYREQWLEKGRQFRQRFHQNIYNSMPEPADPYYPLPGGSPYTPSSCTVQVCRSVSDWSHGVLTEHSIQNAYCQLISEAEHFVYIENQFFISGTREGVIKNRIAQALVARIIRAGREGTKFKVVVVIPEVPGFAGDLKAESSLKMIMAAQYRTINRGGSSIYEEVRKAGYDPMNFIRFYHLRSYDRINAPATSYLSQIERDSNISYAQAQVALARQWIGADIGTADAPKEVIMKNATPTGEAIVVSDKSKPITTRVPIPPSAEEARNVIARFEYSAKRIRGDEDVSDTVAQHKLLDRTGLQSEKWLGTEQEELDCYVSELLYIHTKLMIVDDRRVVMGSANLNDRSQRGDGDSEIVLVVEDNDMIQSFMDGRPYNVSRFAATLRRQLFREHVGLIPPQPCTGPSDPTSFMRPAPYPNQYDLGSDFDRMVADPLSDYTLNLWNDTARRNREIFTEIFRPVPTNLVRDWNAYENYIPKVKPGHVAPGIPLARVKERLALVRGALVECPLDFLIDDKAFVEGPEWIGLNPTLPIYL